MNTLSIVFFSVMGTLLLLSIAVIVGKSFKGRKISQPCYRCAAPATTDYMGLHYCLMCRVVVVRMIAAVRHDPPFGFPGATGYLDWPVEPQELSEDLKKKEESHG